jgi:hypothetical protein
MKKMADMQTFDCELTKINVCNGLYYLIKEQKKEAKKGFPVLNGRCIYSYPIFSRIICVRSAMR